MHTELFEVWWSRNFSVENIAILHFPEYQCFRVRFSDVIEVNKLKKTKSWSNVVYLFSSRNVLTENKNEQFYSRSLTYGFPKIMSNEAGISKFVFCARSLWAKSNVMKFVTLESHIIVWSWRQLGPIPFNFVNALVIVSNLAVLIQLRFTNKLYICGGHWVSYVSNEVVEQHTLPCYTTLEYAEKYQ